MNILLCDDDLHFLKQLEAAVRKECARIFPEKLYYTVVPGCSSAEEVLTFAEKQPVDLLFLDIDMPSMTGFELAKRLNESQPDAVIIFVSGYDHFVYDAFAYSPFAYLRKKRLGKELPLILERYFEKMQAMKKRFCFGYEGLDFSVSEILYFESVKNYYDIYCTDGSVHRCRGTLSQLEEHLTGLDFCRIHSAYLVNLEKIDRIDGGKQLLIKGRSLPIAQTRAAAFKEAYMRYTRRAVK